MTKKWRVRFPTGGKSKQIFDVQAKSTKEAWRLATGKAVVKHGQKVFRNTLFPVSISPIDEEIKPPYKSLAHAARDVLETSTLEEHRRKGSRTSSATREKQRVGAKRSKINKSLNRPKSKTTKSGKIVFLEDSLDEAAASDQRPEIAVTRYSPSKGKFVIVARNQRRRVINTTAPDTYPKGYKGFTGYVNSWTGDQFNN